MRRNLALFGAIVTLYIAAYLLLVEAVVPPVSRGGWGVVHSGPKLANYRFGGRIAEVLFGPVLAVDKVLRAEYWRSDIDGWVFDTSSIEQ